MAVCVRCLAAMQQAGRPESRQGGWGGCYTLLGRSILFLPSAGPQR